MIDFVGDVFLQLAAPRLPSSEAQKGNAIHISYPLDGTANVIPLAVPQICVMKPGNA